MPDDSAPEVLIAGCGTGSHSILAAQRFRGARVLAIDLSLSSISYAKRKTQELGITNIEYAQADILKLGDIARTFDIIESGGVLHHLADPFLGWRILLSRLRPGGFMRLGFYSELARRHVVKAREFIAARGYASTPDDIRRFRQDLTVKDMGVELQWLSRCRTSIRPVIVATSFPRAGASPNARSGRVVPGGIRAPLHRLRVGSPCATSVPRTLYRRPVRH